MSCERIFQPELNNKPVIVLSNNDGCAIARSNEAKALGIKMGQPLFQLTDIIKRHDVRVRSANFTLYGDMSHRIMTIIAELTPKIEIYSIDECFVDVTGMPDVEAWSKTLRKTIYQWTGLPVSIGIARTKVLSKLANKVAKSCSGVYLISAHDERDILAVTKIDDLWGIGKKLSIRLKLMGIYTAMQLVNSPDQLVKDKFSVVLSRLQKELRGESVFALDDHIEAKKQIVFAKLNNCPTSPRKMRIVADSVRGKKVEMALTMLKFSQKEASNKLEKLLLSAIANWQAKNEDGDVEDANLFIKEIRVDSAGMLKRLRPAPQGRAHRIRKRSNHVTLVLESQKLIDS